MRKVVGLLIIALSFATEIRAQTYTDHLQNNVQGQGTVTINESKEIDELVNGKATVTPSEPAITVKKSVAVKKQYVKPTDKDEPQHNVVKPQVTDNVGETETTTVDTRPKVMRRSRSITGYRVQAFAGGNSRNDKLKAQQTGNSIKMAFPNQPVYVHFYSPRWICRMGNYRTYEEANVMLQKVKSLGYKAASIVKGRITVQY